MEERIIFSDRHNKITYKEGDKVYKVFEPTYEQSQVLHEAMDQTIAYELGIRVPKVLEICKIDGKWAIVSEYIEGKTLSNLMKENPDKYDEYMDLFVHLQLGVLDHNDHVLSDVLAKLHRSISRFKMDAVTRYALHDKVSKMVSYDNVCHGDFVPNNIIISNDGEAYILDWAHALRGNPHYDLANTYIQFEIKHSKEAADKYLESVRRLSHYNVEEIKKWIPLISASLSTKVRLKEDEDKLIDIYLNSNI